MPSMPSTRSTYGAYNTNLHNKQSRGLGFHGHDEVHHHHWAQQLDEKHRAECSSQRATTLSKVSHVSALLSRPPVKMFADRDRKSMQSTGGGDQPLPMFSSRREVNRNLASPRLRFTDGLEPILGGLMNNENGNLAASRSALVSAASPLSYTTPPPRPSSEIHPG
jgi:hypothetical protein